MQILDVHEDPPAWWRDIIARWRAKPVGRRGQLDAFARKCALFQGLALPPRPATPGVLLMRPMPPSVQLRLRAVRAQIDNVKAKIQDKGKDKSKGKGKGKAQEEAQDKGKGKGS